MALVGDGRDGGGLGFRVFFGRGHVLQEPLLFSFSQKSILELPHFDSQIADRNIANRRF